MKWPDPKNLICPIDKNQLVIKYPFDENGDYIYSCRKCRFKIKHSMIISILSGETQLSAPKIKP